MIEYQRMGKLFKNSVTNMLTLYFYDMLALHFDVNYAFIKLHILLQMMIRIGMLQCNEYIELLIHQRSIERIK